MSKWYIGYEPLKAEEYWPAEYEQQANDEGWMLTNDSNEHCTVSRIDCPTDHELNYEEPKFDGDLEAQEFLIQRALAGSRLHLLALYLIGHPLHEPLDMDVPTSLLHPALLAKKRLERSSSAVAQAEAELDRQQAWKAKHS